MRSARRDVTTSLSIVDEYIVDHHDHSSECEEVKACSLGTDHLLSALRARSHECSQIRKVEMREASIDKLGLV